MPATLSLIVACTKDRVIGRAGRLPFRLAEDRAWFESHTARKTLLMGRVCFESWPGALREGRQPIVITSSTRPLPSPAQTAPTISAALALARVRGGEIMVCGGQSIYEETLPLADRLYLTLVSLETDGDRWFPEWRGLHWRESHRRESDADGVHCSYLILERERSRDIAPNAPDRTHPMG